LDISDLVQAVFAAQAKAPSVAPGSIPVLYFGNADAYFESCLRIVTVGLNPSGEEFPEQNRTCRFPHHQRPTSGDNDITSQYLVMLNGYFERCSYDWLGRGYGSVLDGMGAGYYAPKPTRAIHTDLCSPYATQPTWSELENGVQGVLMSQGVRWWREVVQWLRPDIFIISVSKVYLTHLLPASASPTWPHPTDPHVITITSPRRDGQERRPHYVYHRVRDLGHGNHVLVAFGQAANRPFATVQDDDKRKIGAAILSTWKNLGNHG